MNLERPVCPSLPLNLNQQKKWWEVCTRTGQRRTSTSKSAALEKFVKEGWLQGGKRADKNGDSGMYREVAKKMRAGPRKSSHGTPSAAPAGGISLDEGDSQKKRGQGKG